LSIHAAPLPGPVYAGPLTASATVAMTVAITATVQPWGPGAARALGILGLSLQADGAAAVARVLAEALDGLLGASHVCVALHTGSGVELSRACELWQGVWDAGSGLAPLLAWDGLRVASGAVDVRRSDGAGRPERARAWLLRAGRPKALQAGPT
jgi:hypothetical protein